MVVGFVQRAEFSKSRWAGGRGYSNGNRRLTKSEQLRFKIHQQHRHWGCSLPGYSCRGIFKQDSFSAEKEALNVQVGKLATKMLFS